MGLEGEVKARLKIKDEAGREVWQQELRLPASIESGETELVSFRWEPGPEVEPGGYVLQLESDTELWAHQVCFRIEQGVKREGMPER